MNTVMLMLQGVSALYEPLIHFRYQGRLINPRDTPHSLGMVGGEEIIFLIRPLSDLFAMVDEEQLGNGFKNPKDGKGEY